MESLGILSSNNGETFSKQLLNFSQKYQIKKEKNKEKIKQWRENQSVIENVTSYEPICNSSKVNKNKVNKNKVNILEDIKSYFLENGYSEIAAKKFFDYYSVANWKDSKGNEVKNWKQKAQAVWFKPENKTQSNEPKFVM
jgi:hypothetical protein